jgi:hypothetical protein
MDGIVRESVIVAVASGIGMCFGAFCTRLGIIAVRFTARILPQIALPQTTKSPPETAQIGGDRIRRMALVIGILSWGAALGSQAAHAIWLVHWWEQQTVIYSDHARPYFWQVATLTLVGLTVALGYAAFRIARERFSAGISVIWVPVILAIHLAAFLPVAALISIYSHFAAGGLE